LKLSLVVALFWVLYGWFCSHGYALISIKFQLLLFTFCGVIIKFSMFWSGILEIIMSSCSYYFITPIIKDSLEQFRFLHHHLILSMLKLH
jgi:hypothetical protein